MRNVVSKKVKIKKIYLKKEIATKPKEHFEAKSSSDDETKEEVKKYAKELGLLGGQQCYKKKNQHDRTKRSKLLDSTKSSHADESKKDGNSNKIEKKKKKKNKYKIQVNEISSTVPEIKILLDEKPQESLLIKPGVKWFEHNLHHHYDRLLTEDPINSNNKNVIALKSSTEHLLARDVELYRKGKSVRKDFGWIQTVLKNGTLSDKVSAYTLLIQDSAIHNISSIDSLIGMVNIKGKRECLMAVDALRDLFLSDLLLEDKKLQKFEQFPITKLDSFASGNQDAKKRLLMLWYFEDQLKERYSKFVRALEALTHDPVEKMQSKAVVTMSDLLINNPEQEEFLLETLVNKLGHPTRSVAARVCHLLGQLVNQHPNMKTIIVFEVERLLYRQNISQRAQYYALCFLNQLLLLPEDSTLAFRLIRIYVGFFKACTKTGEVENKMMSALLTGVNRAYPFVKGDKSAILQQMDTLYQIIHLVGFNISIQALMLLFQIQDADETLSDRFYVALYKKLLDPGLGHSTRQTMFLNLLYRALKRDKVEQRIKAFVKRLFQVCEYQAPGLVCGALILVSQLLKQHPNLLNYRKIHEETDEEYDEDEHYDDVPSEDEEEKEITEDKQNLKKARSKKVHKSSWLHRNNLEQKQINLTTYDPHHRNPLYCGANNVAVWELSLLTNHYHPSVAVFSHQLLNNKSIDYSGDPLHDFTLIRFLDKFVYRNPKKPKDRVLKDDHHRVFGHIHQFKQKDLKTNMMNKREDTVLPEERFLYQYFLNSKSQKEEKDDSDIESVTSEDFEKLLNKLEPCNEADELDFAADVAASKGKGKKRKQNENNEDILDDDEIGFDDDEDFNKAFEDYQSDFEEINMKDTEFDDKESEENDGFLEEPNFNPVKKRRKDKTKATKQSVDQMGLFASAEEFSNLLEENQTNLDAISTQAMETKDKAHAKQLKWEISRDKWIHDADWKTQKNQRFQKRKRNVKQQKRQRGNVYKKLRH